MKKSLLAVAVAAALPAAAFAQTNVTLYGIVDLGLAYQSNGSTSAIKIDSGMLSSSRWGLRGTEDLGGGLKATFNVEGGVNNDDGTGKTGGALDFRRASTLGLEGGFGSFKMGRFYTPAFLKAGSWDALGYGHFGNTLNYTAGGATVGGIATVGTSVRFSNAVFYDTPAMGGFNLGAAYGFGEVFGDQGQGRGFSLAGGYTAGPVNIGAYFETTNSAGAAGAAINTTKKLGVGGGYNFGAFELMGGYQRATPDVGSKVTFVNIGGKLNAGPGQFIAQYSQMKVDLTGGKTNTIGLAYDYPLSKRTMGYVTFAQATNSAAGVGSLFSSDTAVAPAAAGNTARGFGLGIRHSF